MWDLLSFAVFHSSTVWRKSSLFSFHDFTQSQTTSTVMTMTWAGRCGALPSSVWRRWSARVWTSCSPSTPPSAPLCWHDSRSARRTSGPTSSLLFQRCWDKHGWHRVATASSCLVQIPGWEERRSRQSPCWKNRCWEVFGWSLIAFHK